MVEQCINNSDLTPQNPNTSKNQDVCQEHNTQTQDQTKYYASVCLTNTVVKLKFHI